MSHTGFDSLRVPSQGKGHSHRRSAAISLDWRHVQLPPVEPPIALPLVRPISCSPTLTFASTLSDSSLDDADNTPIPSTQVSTASAPISRRPKKCVIFLDVIEEIPAGEQGDTWLKPEDYSWPIPSTDSKTVLLDCLEPSIDLAPATPQQVPGSPVLMHRKKRSSFLQSTKNALTRRPSKKRPNSPPQPSFDMPVPAPKSSMIDLDLALGPHTSLRHQKSGSLGAFSGLPASPSKPKSWHRRSDSAPADILFSFSPRPASPDSRKRKMTSILEHPSTPSVPLEVVQVRLDTLPGSRSQNTGLKNVIADDMIFGEPGDMISVRTSTESVDSPAVLALKGHTVNGTHTIKSKKGWKGMLQRLLH